MVRTQYTTHCRTDNGKDKYGDDWEESFSSRIEEADDITATDMMQHKDDELEGFVDYDIRDMGKGLLKHPKEKPLPGPGQLLVPLLATAMSQPLASPHLSHQPKCATSPFRHFNCLAPFLKMRSPSLAS